MNQVEHNSTIAINNIQPNIIKIAAKTLIDQVARAKNNIDQTSNATIEEKAAKQKLTKKLQKQNIVLIKQ